MKPLQPLAEVFGHLPTDFGPNATRYRKHRLCPFNNKVPSCTKDKAKNPLGVCSINFGEQAVITCPLRFREDWIITEEAAAFFFEPNTKWTSLTEVHLPDQNGRSAGNIDVVLVAYDERGKVIDFGSLEIQAVYISGNVRDPFTHYMTDCCKHANMDWRGQPNFPRPDFLSSSRKRLAPQLLFKGGILHAWNKKMAVALDSSFFRTLPNLEEVPKEQGEIAWLVYDLVLSADGQKLGLQNTKIVYTKFQEALVTITQPKVGSVTKFMSSLQAKLDVMLESPPDNEVIANPFE